MRELGDSAACAHDVPPWCATSGGGRCRGFVSGPGHVRISGNRAKGLLWTLLQSSRTSHRTSSWPRRRTTRSERRCCSRTSACGCGTSRYVPGERIAVPLSSHDLLLPLRVGRPLAATHDRRRGADRRGRPRRGHLPRACAGRAARPRADEHRRRAPALHDRGAARVARSARLRSRFRSRVGAGRGGVTASHPPPTHLGGGPG